MLRRKVTEACNLLNPDMFVITVVRPLTEE